MRSILNGRLLISFTIIQRKTFNSLLLSKNIRYNARLILFVPIRYRHSLVFVVRPFPECLQADNVRLLPKMNELLEYTDKMEAVLKENGIAYTLIDVLNLQERLEIVKQKIMEFHAIHSAGPEHTNKEISVGRDD